MGTDFSEAGKRLLKTAKWIEAVVG